MFKIIIKSFTEQEISSTVKINPFLDQYILNRGHYFLKFRPFEILESYEGVIYACGGRLVEHFNQYMFLPKEYWKHQFHKKKVVLLNLQSTNQPPTTVYSYEEWLDSHKPPKICGSTCINSPSILGIAQWERENGFFRSSSLE